MQQLKISFFRLQPLKKALLFSKNFRKGVGGNPLNPSKTITKLDIAPQLAKVLVAPLKLGFQFYLKTKKTGFAS